MTPRRKGAWKHTQKADVLAVLMATHGLVHPAAKLLKCSPQTIYNWRDRDDDVRLAIENARDFIVDVAEKSLLKAVESGEPWAVALALKTIGKHRGYTERQEITGADGGPLDIVIKGYVNVSPEDL